MKLTHEQIAIVEAKDDIVLVEAGAGAAKTSTLIQYALANPHERLLYLAFNSSIKDEAKTKFPSNVSVQTSHGRPYGEIGKHFSSKMAGSLRPYTVLKALDLKNRGGVDEKFIMLLAQRIIETLTNFITTTDEELTVEHAVFDSSSNIEAKALNRHAIAQFANEAWEMMCDVNDTRVPMVHDGYLKLFMLSGGSYGRYSRILFDEAQDSNPVTMQILTNQQCKKTFVGDKNQSIYKFRGAVDAMSMIDNATKYRLTGSFRFGPEIANAANKLLYLKGSTISLNGLAGNGIVESREAEPQAQISDPYMFISRGTFKLLEEAIKQMELKKSINFVGGSESYRFSRLDDVYALRYNKDVKDPFIKMFEDYDALKSYSENDFEMASCIRIVDTYGVDLPDTLAKLKEATKTDKKDANIIFTTAHKAKGLEHDNVVLSEDFTKSMSLSCYVNSLGVRVHNREEEEMNIAYVAMTRAKKRLVLPIHAHSLFKDPDIDRQSMAFHAGNRNPNSILNDIKNDNVVYIDPNTGKRDSSADVSDVQEHKQKRRNRHL